MLHPTSVDYALNIEPFRGSLRFGTSAGQNYEFLPIKVGADVHQLPDL
jgi:hypothetical protein